MIQQNKLYRICVLNLMYFSYLKAPQVVSQRCHLFVVCFLFFFKTFMVFILFIFIFLAAPRGLAGSWFPDQGLNLGPRQWKPGILTIGPPGNSVLFVFQNTLHVIVQAGKLGGVLDLLFLSGLSHPIIGSLVLPLNHVGGQKKVQTTFVSYLSI